MSTLAYPNLPGVRIKEESAISPTIQSVPSSVAAFVGETNIGTPNVAIIVESFLDFTAIFGDAVVAADYYPMAAAVRAFFENGGYRAYIVKADNSTTPGTSPDLQGYKDAIDVLGAEDEPAIVACPDMASDTNFDAIAEHLIGHCSSMGDRFGLIDMPDDDLATDGSDPTVTKAGALGGDLQHAAAYFPHLTLADYPGQVVPPSGHVAGAIADTDLNRGVWKAPANISLRAEGLSRKVTDSRQNGLNAANVNVIRSFSGRGIRIWGARTLYDTTSDTNWRYVSVRRFFTMVGQSVKKSTAWAVFEPNSPSTWRTIKVMLENYFTNLWKEGALLGSEPSHAFVVRVGLNETMSAADVQNGNLIIEVGLAAVRPAEFITFKVFHKGLEV